MSLEGKNYKEVLDEIVKYLNRNDLDSIALWSVLSALRGPDGQSGSYGKAHEVKTATTGVIRYKIGLDYFSAIENEDNSFAVELRKNTKDSFDSKHFEHHAKEAFKVLGLDWGNLNVIERKKL